MKCSFFRSLFTSESVSVTSVVLVYFNSTPNIEVSLQRPNSTWLKIRKLHVDYDEYIYIYIYTLLELDIGHF